MAAKPVLLCVDDEPEVLRAIERDLRQGYGESYRVLRASSGASALATLEQLRTRNSPLALLLVDQRMPEMSGVELLARSLPLFPTAKRVLLTAYADTDAAVRAINVAQIDYYLLKPWEPPSERLYPPLNELLADWQASYRPAFEGVTVIGHRWSPKAFEIRNFLARNLVPYRWLDIERSSEAQRLAAVAGSTQPPAAGEAQSAAVNGETPSTVGEVAVTGEAQSAPKQPSVMREAQSEEGRAAAPGQEASEKALPEPPGPAASGPSAAPGPQSQPAPQSPPELPLVFFPDGTWLADPSRGQLAEKLGLKTRAENAFYDLVILGGGPSGLAAAVYGASEGLHTLLVERDAPGGQAGTSSRIENYLGFPEGLSGAALTWRAVQQARRFGVEILEPQEAVALRREDPYRVITLADGTQVSCHTLIIATGVSYRKLDVPGIDPLTGAGVYYGAALTEAMACRGDDVFLVGGANSAGQAALYFAQFARRVVMLVRADSLQKGMSQYLVDRIAQTSLIEVRLHSVVVGVHGESRLEAIDVRDNRNGTVTTVPARALFIFIGAEPRTAWLDGVVERDERGFVVSGRDLLRDGKPPAGWTLERNPYLLETSVPGVFVAGDVRLGSVKRIATGVGEGAFAVSFVHQYLQQV
jgi:thioredoxin reductase (NADPH)